MLDALKTQLYKFKEQQTNDRILRQLQSQIAGAEPIYMVHQVGRVASMTLTNSLQAALPGEQIYHTHYLNTNTLEERRAVENRLGRPLKQRHFRVSELLAPVIAAGKGQIQWQIVTVIRDPVARNISAFYLSIEDYMPGFNKRFLDGEIGTSGFTKRFLESYNQDYALNWFDREVNQVFDVDVYTHGFDTALGYSVIREKSLNLLTIKVEKIRECLEPAVENFLGVKEIVRKDTHVTARDEEDNVYSRLLEEIRLPADYLDHMYNSKFMEHFYSPEEQSMFRKKWIRGSSN